MVYNWSYTGDTVPKDISIKDVEDDVVERLKARAKRNHRSLNGELKAIAEAAVNEPERLTPMEILKRVRKLGIRTEPRGVDIIRHDRDHEH